MASIRRILSPATQNSRYPSPPAALHRRRPPPSTAPRRHLIRFLLCFVAGTLIGLSFFPFAEFHFSVDADADELILPPPSAGVGRKFEILLSDAVSAAVKDEVPDFRVPEIDSPPKKLLIVVTPTYNRALQAYYLGRLGQTLRLVSPPLLWVVVEMGEASMETAEVLMRSRVMYRHLVCRMNSSEVKDRGVYQRNAAIEHIEQHRLDGIVYFADDDNIYTLELFDRLREIRRFGTWPVAMLAQSKSKVILEGPVCNGSKVIGWHTNEKSKRLRRFHVDMSGFAFNSTILWDPRRWRRPTLDAIRQLDTVKEGFQETTFIEQIVEDEAQMEGLPDGCSKIMNWHLHLETKNLVYPRGWQLSRNLDSVVPLN